MSGPEREPLRGWRAIADHLGRSVRTVQRWEDQHGLPVEREGDSVVARADELDRWLRSWARYGSLPPGEADEPAPSGCARPVARDEGAEPEVPSATPPGAGLGAAVARPGGVSPPGPRQERRSRWAGLAARLGVLLLVTAPVAGGFAWHRASSGAEQPAAWRIASRTLYVSDAAGRLLFSHPLEARTPRVFTHDPRFSESHQLVRFLDIDGDAALEVLVRTPIAARGPGKVFCFEADGRLRFTVQGSGSKRFGRVEYGEPWLVGSTFSTTAADGTRSLWVIWVHNTWFPSRIQRVAPDGAVLAEYWSAGHILSVEEARLGGRDVVLIGATNNEWRGASLAVLDRERVGGRAPAAKQDYACGDCGEGDPLAFLVFPSSCVWQRSGTGSAVVGASVGEDGRLEVVVSGGQAEVAGPLEASRLTYRFSAQLELEDVRVEADFVRLHAMLFGRGMLDHPLGPTDAANLFPVRRWDGKRFVELPRAPVVR